MAAKVFPDWKPVTTKPQETGYYLVYTNDSLKTVAYFDGGVFDWRIQTSKINGSLQLNMGYAFINSCFVARKVTHWVEMPSAPINVRP